MPSFDCKSKVYLDFAFSRDSMWVLVTNSGANRIMWSFKFRFLSHMPICFIGSSSEMRIRENGFGGSLTGDTSFTKHGHLIIETTVNREVKVWEGLMQGGYSTDLDPTNIFVKNSHLLTTLRSVLKERIHLLTS